MMTKEVKKEVISWLITAALAIAVALFIDNVIIVNAEVPTGSMETLIMPGDRVVANRLSYIAADPKRYDVVVFRFPDDESLFYVKRIIGLPGETVNIIGGEVYINNSTDPLEDSFVASVDTRDFGPYTVPEDSYFMMGDNRSVSEDARFWENTYLKRDKMIGKVIFRYYPNISLLLDK